MVIHPEKSQYMTVNTDDTTPFVLEDIYISHTEKYCYLGAVITADPIHKQVVDHIKNKQRHVWKSASFLHKNRTAPFMVKERVLQGALNSALLYGCESWLTGQVKCVETAILGCIKQMLGVRTQTSTDLVYLESGIAPVSAEIKKRQYNFLNKVRNRLDFADFPVGKALHSAIQLRTSMGSYITKYIDGGLSDHMQIILDRVTDSTSSRMCTYRELNPRLSVHPVYYDLSISELARLAFTRLRLGSHYLRVETGRWSRVEHSQRLCACQGSVQTEEHVLLKCPLTEPLRTAYSALNYTDLNTLMNSSNINHLTRYCQDILFKMERNY
jgi:hypothetical protein